MTDRDGVKRANRRLVGQLLTVAVAMFGFGYLLVPLYDVFCEITGFGGKTGGQVVQTTVVEPDTSRMVTVEFVAAVGGSAGFEFRPTETRMRVHPGQLYTTSYTARNLSAAEASGQAVPSVTPGAAARYFQKTECFCFTRQDFAADELKDMPVLFIIDPELPPEVTTVTLGYTFFDARG